MFLQSIYKTMMSRPHPRIVTPNSTLFPIVNSVSADLYAEALKHTQYLKCEDLKILQEKRISHLISSARSISFYKKHLENFRSAEDFDKIPPVAKDIIRLEFEKGRAHNPYYNPFKFPQFTSGSTGIPFHFYLDSNMFPRRKAVYRRLLEWTGWNKENFAIRLMPKEHPGLEGEAYFFQCVDPFDLEKKFFEICKLFERQSSIIVQSRTSHLVRLAQLLELHQKKYSFKSIISYTEQLPPEVRKYLIRVLDAPVYDYYGTNEMTAIAQECEEQQGMHVNSEWVYLEIVDDKNQKVAPGVTGDILLTSFENEVMPFIRYKSGDCGFWINEPCACGRTLPKIKIEGRKVGSFLRPDGQIGYFSSLIWPIASLVHNIFQYQVIRHTKNKFEIRISPLKNFNNRDRQFIIEKFKEYLGERTKIIFKTVDAIKLTPGGKSHAFVNLMPDYL